MVPKLLVHGGAGRYRKVSEERRQRVLREIENALDSGISALRSGSAIEGVVEAVSYMEQCGAFNAGRGSVLNLRGEAELDAGVMFGLDLSVGAVAALKDYWNAVRLADFIRQNTDHIFLAGEGARLLAEKLAMEKFKPLPERVKKYRELMRKFKENGIYWRKNRQLVSRYGLGTVGAVAIDSDGNLAAASSTGGIWLKLPGRVGDTPVVGGGFYAENGAAAASATGRGELIARFMLSARIAAEVRRGLNASDAAKKVVQELTDMFGANTAGVIVIDCDGNYGYAYNTEVFIMGIYNGERIETKYILEQKNSST